MTYTDDIESAGMVPKQRIPGKEQARGADQFGLFSAVHRLAGVDEAAMAARPYLNEGEARAINHDEVDLAAARPEIPGNGLQSMTAKESERVFFCASP